ncbi:hypothetical protein AB0M23_30765 [Streptomyces sp. NPDC052077]|uniref:hypothetical protein n=1 Tax=Streptomyces sp. NPDC052077 TaxID=3154757 RepID=UPI003441C3F3
MASIGYAGLPVPGGGQAPTVPGDLAALAAAIDPHLLQYVTNKAQRDADFATAPVHTTVSAADGTLWKKTGPGAGDWVTLWEPLPPWRPITPAAGTSTVGDAPHVRLTGQYVHVIGALARADNTNWLGDLILGTVPADCVPPRRRRYAGSVSLGGDTTDAAVRIEIMGAAEATPGQVLAYYQAPGGTPWIDLSGGYWKDGPA